MTLKNQKEEFKTDDTWVITRRAFLRFSVWGATGILLRPFASLAASAAPVRIGIMTDSHYAELSRHNSRYYKESLAKMAECVELMNDKKVDFMIELGDLINGAQENNFEHLQAIETVYGRFSGPRYHVLGNHDLDKLSKTQFQSVVGNTEIPQESAFYSFDQGGLHVVVLDANYSSDGSEYDSGNFHWADANIPKKQLEWLERDLYATENPVIVCVHQLLDHDEGSYYINNAKEVRRILENHPRILAVFQGHQHQGQYRLINGIHYVTFQAMVEGTGKENNAYSIVDVNKDGSLTITGYRKAKNRELLRE